MSEVESRSDEIAALRAELTQLRSRLRHQDAAIEKLKLQLARLRRQQFGRSSEKLAQEIEQLELLIEESETPTPAMVAATAATPRTERPARKPLPEHLPREAIAHAAACACPACGGELRRIGEDVSEVLDYVPEQWKVLRHVREKKVCDACDRIVQAPAPSRPIARGLAGPGLLAHVLVGKYADHRVPRTHRLGRRCGAV